MKKKWNLVLILIGTLLMGAAVKIIYEPLHMVTGGVSGVGIIIQSLIGIPMWFTNMIINIPLLIIAAYIKGTRFIIKTLYATVCFTVALYLLPEFEIVQGDYLLGALAGGVISGIGLGLVFYTGTSTGGSDLLGIVLQRKFRHYSIAQIILVIDGMIVMGGAWKFGLKNALYAVIAVYITSKVMDGILEGINFSKLAYVISEHYEEIASDIFVNLNRGVTSLFAKGMYSKKQKNVLLCVVSKKEIVELMDIVAKNDPKAFVIVTDVREVMGEGFIEYKQ